LVRAMQVDGYRRNKKMLRSKTGEKRTGRGEVGGGGQRSAMMLERAVPTNPMGLL
jgi:hypothetical protein